MFCDTSVTIRECVIWLIETNLSRWQRLTRCIVLITIAFPANLLGRTNHTHKILLRPLAKPVHFTIRQKCEWSEMRGSPRKDFRFTSPLQPFNGLDILSSTRYNKGTKQIVCIDSQFPGYQTHFFIKFAMDR